MDDKHLFYLNNMSQQVKFRKPYLQRNSAMFPQNQIGALAAARKSTDLAIAKQTHCSSRDNRR